MRPIDAQMYYLWTVKCMNSETEYSIARVVAQSEESALQEAEQLLPGRKGYGIVEVGAYWLPSITSDKIANAIKGLG